MLDCICFGIILHIYLIIWISQTDLNICVSTLILRMLRTGIAQWFSFHEILSGLSWLVVHPWLLNLAHWHIKNWSLSWSFQQVIFVKSREFFKSIGWETKFKIFSQFLYLYPSLSVLAYNHCILTNNPCKNI